MTSKESVPHGRTPRPPAQPPAQTIQPPAQTIQLLLLDGFSLLHDGAPIVVPRGLQRIIALIGLRPGATRAHLAGLLWPDTAEERAMSSLRTALWRLRQEGSCPVLTAGDTVRLDPVVMLDIDDLVRAAERVRDGADPRRASNILTAGRHDLLPGWYDEWVLPERERLRQLRLHMLEEIARSNLRAGQHGEALQAALEAVRAEPLRETPHRLIVETHLAEGNAYEALQAFYVYRDLLLRELQLEPSEAMCGLLSDLLAPIPRPTITHSPRPKPQPSRPGPPYAGRSALPAIPGQR